MLPVWWLEQSREGQTAEISVDDNAVEAVAYKQKLAAMIGFFVSIVSLIFAFEYLVYKLMFWYDFAVGIAPLVIGLLFFSRSAVWKHSWGAVQRARTYRYED
jgi:hypothetical protein